MSIRDKGNGSDFIGFLIDLDLAQNKSIGVTPSAYHVNGCFGGGLVKGRSQCLAVDRDDLSFSLFPNTFDPMLKTLPELLRVEPGENPSEGVVRGDSIRQRQKTPEPPLLGLAEKGNLGPLFGSADHCADGDHDDIDEEMSLLPIDPRVNQVAKMSNSRGKTSKLLGHDDGYPPVEGYPSYYPR